MKSYPVEDIDGVAHTKCPACDQGLAFYVDAESCEHSTSNCPGCDALLLVVEGKIWPFHEKLNSEDPIWPKDGAGTGSIQL